MHKKPFKQVKTSPDSKKSLTIDEVVSSEKTFPDKPKGDRFKELKKYLKSC